MIYIIQYFRYYYILVITFSTKKLRLAYGYALWSVGIMVLALETGLRGGVRVRTGDRRR